MVIDDKHKEVQPAGWFVWMKSSIVGCGVSLSVALSLIRTYLNTSGCQAPVVLITDACCILNTERDSFYQPRSRWRSPCSMTVCWAEITLTHAASLHWEEARKRILHSETCLCCWAQISKQLLQTTNLWMWPKSRSERKEQLQFFLVEFKPFLSFEALGAGLAPRSGDVPLLHFLIILYKVEGTNLSQ